MDADDGPEFDDGCESDGKSNGDDDENFDPEKTLVREDWESVVLRRVAPHIEAVQEAVDDEESFGWESEGLRRLSREVQSRSDL